MVLVVGARLLGQASLHRGVQDEVGLLGQVGVGVAHQRGQGHAFAAQQRHQHLDFGRVAAFADGHHKVLGLNHAQVAVDGVGGVHKQGRRAGAVERGHDFAGNVGAFANARHHYPAGKPQNGFHAADEVGRGSQGDGHVVQGGGLFVQHLPGNGQHVGGSGCRAGKGISEGIGSRHRQRAKWILQNWERT